MWPAICRLETSSVPRLASRLQLSAASTPLPSASRSGEVTSRSWISTLAAWQRGRSELAEEDYVKMLQWKFTLEPEDEGLLTE